MTPYLKEKEAVLAEMNSSMDGLTDEEATSRLAKDGPNRLKEGEKESRFRKFLGELKDPMTIVLIAAAVVSAVTAVYAGESLTDAVIILAVVLINACLGVYQENKAEAAIEALQQVAAATAKVIRGGHQETIRADQVVRGDLLVLEAGDAVPADARIVECASMKTQEAALTGESTDVEKQCEVLQAAENGSVSLGDRKNMVYMGSIVTYGRGHAVVTGTGMDTEMGSIANALTNAKDEETPLQIKLRELSRKLSAMILIICAFVFIVNLVRNGGKAVMDTFMIAVSLAVAAIPEGLSAVVTVLLSIGVTKMSKNHAIIRKLTAVETLGCTQIICSDKTGTLTQNKMTVVRKVTSDEKLLMSAMALCSDAELEQGEAVGEATECALVNDAYRNGLPKDELAADLPRVDEAPFDSLRKMMTTLHRAGAGHGFIQFTKGAPDEVLRRCTKIWQNGQAVPITKEHRNKILEENKAMADQALRVLAAAQRIYDERPDSNAPETLEQDLTWVGMCGMIDPIRPEVKEAIGQCRNAGIRPIMITGDHKDTATAIARDLGILVPGQMAIPGAELDVCRGPMDVLAADSVRELLDRRPDAPAILAEVGAVKPNHTGPSELYPKDKLGMLLHDEIFAPFFAGSAGCGQPWHWDHQYLDGNNLWWHFARFAAAVKDVDPAAEHFRPFHTETRRLRVWGLRGERTTLLWCRDKSNTWESELVRGEAPATVSGEKIPFAKGLKCYLPWENRWVEVEKGGMLPDFKRSIVARFESISNGKGTK